MAIRWLVGRVLGTVNGTVIGTVFGVAAFLAIGGEFSALLWEPAVRIASTAFVGAASAAMYYFVKPIPGELAGALGGIVGFAFVWYGIPSLPPPVPDIDEFVVKYVVVFVLVPFLPTLE